MVDRLHVTCDQDRVRRRLMHLLDVIGAHDDRAEPAGLREARVEHDDVGRVGCEIVGYLVGPDGVASDVERLLALLAEDNSADLAQRLLQDGHHRLAPMRTRRPGQRHASEVAVGSQQADIVKAL